MCFNGTSGMMRQYKKFEATIIYLIFFKMQQTSETMHAVVEYNLSYVSFFYVFIINTVCINRSRQQFPFSVNFTLEHLQKYLHCFLPTTFIFYRSIFPFSSQFRRCHSNFLHSVFFPETQITQFQHQPGKSHRVVISVLRQVTPNAIQAAVMFVISFSGAELASVADCFITASLKREVEAELSHISYLNCIQLTLAVDNW